MGYLSCPVIPERASSSNGPYTTATDPKLVMLCALVTGQRCQSLHLMNLGSMHMDIDNSYVFHITQLVKQSAPGKAQPVLVIPRFLSDEGLCVATVLDEYIK